jgi:Cu+-exporting ATPase
MPEDPDLTTLRLAIGGMHCAACAARIERVTSRLPGMHAATVSLTANEGAFTFDPNQVEIHAIQKVIEEAGFTAQVIEEADPDEELRRQDEREAARAAALARRALWAWVFAGPLLLIAMGPMLGLPLPTALDPHVGARPLALLQLALALATAWVCRDFYRDGIQALLRRAPNMDTLVALGTGAALLHSLGTMTAVFSPTFSAHDLYFESAGTVLAMIALGKAMETRAMRQAAEAVRGLLRLAPEEATLVEDAGERRVPVRLVLAGMRVRVRPGERIPVDGTVAAGEGHVDESMLTGESRPVRRAPGDPVFTGSINLDGSLVVEAVHVGRETLLARVAALVAQAQNAKAPIAALADRISLVFVPAVLVIAAGTFLAWLAAHAPLTIALRHAVSVLVIACPCAMGLATPTAILVGSGRGARLGILFKSGAAMERLAQATDVVFDKTGTLTQGQMHVTHVLPLAHLDGPEVLALAAAVEAASEHPIARAIAAAKPDAVPAEDFQAHPGRGAQGRVDGKTVLVGSLRFLAQHEVVVPAEAQKEAARLEDTGSSVVAVAVEGTFAGLVAVGDSLRPEAHTVTTALRELGLTLHLLSGDTPRVARTVAGQLDIASVQAGVLPDGKAAWVGELVAQGRRPAMVGDGINDAPALAAAWVGIAMGSGQDIAVQAGDVVLLRGELSALVDAVALARATMRHVRQNLFWAFAFNTLGIPLAAGALEPWLGWSISPMFAGAAMAMSSLLVVGNALRLRLVPLSASRRASAHA